MSHYGVFIKAAGMYTHAAPNAAPDTYAAFVSAAVGRERPRSASFGEGDPVDLARYMDQVNKDVNAFDAWVTETRKQPTETDRLSQGFFGSWLDFYASDPPTRDTNGKPLGWRAFYREYRGWLLPDYLDNWIFGDGEALWDQTEAYEEQLIRYYDWAVDEGGEPPIARPQLKYQPPPAGSTIEGKVEAALKWVGVIGLIAAAGYLLHALPRKGGD